MFNTTEIEIGADNRKRKLIATMQNLYDIEENVGSIYSLAMRCRAAISENDVSKALKMKEIRDVIFYGLQGDIDNPLQKNSIELEIFKRGYLHFAMPVAMFLMTALSGGEAQAKGADEPAVTTTEPATS